MEPEWNWCETRGMKERVFIGCKSGMKRTCWIPESTLSQPPRGSGAGARADSRLRNCRCCRTSSRGGVKHNSRGEGKIVCGHSGLCNLSASTRIRRSWRRFVVLRFSPLYTYIYIYIYFLCLFMYACLCVYIYIYMFMEREREIYTHTYVYIHIYIYIHIHM